MKLHFYTKQQKFGGPHKTSKAHQWAAVHWLKNTGVEQMRYLQCFIFILRVSIIAIPVSSFCLRFFLLAFHE